MTSLFSTAIFLIAAAITPGPNNLVVMRNAARSGWTGALPAVVGVVTGGLTLLAVVTAGADSAFSTWPWLRAGIVLGGAIYLVLLGLRLFMSAGDNRDLGALPAGMMGLFGFQLLNPKGWIMVLTVVAALNTPTAIHAFLRLAPLFIIIPVPCLLLWAGLGRALRRHLASPLVRLWTDRTLGALLVVAALLLFV